MSSTAGVQSSSSRARSQNAASRSTATRLSSTRASCEPTWKCTPATSMPSARASAIDARAPRPAASPNFDSSCAVWIDWCVTASTPGVSRTSTRRTPAAAARAGSSGASSTTVAPAAAAPRSSSSDLLLPWKRIRSPAIPARLRERELAERRDVGADALLGEQPQQRDVRERLRPVDDERARRRRRGRRAPARGSSPRSRRRAACRARAASCAARDAAERELAVVDPRGIGKELEHAAC